MKKGILEDLPDIAITGRAGVGKSTAARFFARYYGYNRGSLAAPLKSLALEFFQIGPDDKYTERGRTLLQDLGKALTDLDSDVFVNLLHDRMQAAREQPPGQLFVVDDLRQPWERDYFKREGFLILKIVGPQRGVALTAEQQEHPTESVHIDADRVIDNSFTFENLYKRLEGALRDAVHKG